MYTVKKLPKDYLLFAQRLQNAKKNGNEQNFQGQNREGHSYGSGKRSLGGRTRSVNSKFVPPVKSNSQE